MTCCSRLPCTPALNDTNTSYSPPSSRACSHSRKNSHTQRKPIFLVPSRACSYTHRAWSYSISEHTHTQRKPIFLVPSRACSYTHRAWPYSISEHTHKRRNSIKCCTIPPPINNGHPLNPNPDLDRFPEKFHAPQPPPRPKRIILVRHGQSEGNVDESAYTRIPDNQIALTETGWKQAIQCGKAIRELIESDGADDWRVYFYVSPYKRTLQSLRGIGMAFERDRIAGVREEPRLREQDFGNFQDREKMRKEKQVRLRYGRFFYRFPDGESAADVYDRITGFRETLRADIDIGRFQRPESRSKDINLVLVSHGLTLRVFLTRWYKWTVKQFEALHNFTNAGFLVMQLGNGGRYSLLVHHTREELKDFGLTDEMLLDQEWQKDAKVGELNYDWITSGPSFFSHFDLEDEVMNNEAAPPDIIKNII